MNPVKDTKAARIELFAAMERGELELREAIRKLRRIMGLSQNRYAELAGIAPRVLMNFERGKGNPTLDTLEKIGRPFGLRLVFRQKTSPGQQRDNLVYAQPQRQTHAKDMHHYYVNKSKQPAGEHEIHRDGCTHPASPSNRDYLGTFDHCRGAIVAARRKGYSPVDGCAFCSPACHNR